MWLLILLPLKHVGSSVFLTVVCCVFQEKESIAKCITDLKALAKASQAKAAMA